MGNHIIRKTYMLEKMLMIKLFLNIWKLGTTSKSMVGTTYDDRMALVTRVSDGKRVKYSSNVVKTPII